MAKKHSIETYPEENTAETPAPSAEAFLRIEVLEKVITAAEARIAKLEAEIKKCRR